MTKRYGDFTAVDAVSMTARPGRILGVLGPNGAGKTSTIRMITGITLPDAGRVTVGGVQVGAETQARMGYLPEERGLYRKLKVGEQLVYFAELRGLARAEGRARTAHWLERLGLSEWAGRKTEELSKGMQQKLQFVMTVLHEPDLLVFDEPFSGLDPINAELLRDIVLELRADGRTILFASHRMEQVERLCDDLCLIARGRVVLSGTMREVKQRFGRDVVLLDFGGTSAFLDTLEARRRDPRHRARPGGGGGATHRRYAIAPRPRCRARRSDGPLPLRTRRAIAAGDLRPHRRRGRLWRWSLMVGC